MTGFAMTCSLRHIFRFVLLLLSVCIPCFSGWASSVPLDRFGIRMLYPTVPQGREWFCSWNEGPVRTITWGADQVDSSFFVRGNTECLVYGKSGEFAGQILLTGSTPRLYVRSFDCDDGSAPEGAEQWNNVEITFYAKTVDAGSRLTYAGIEAVCKTNHCPDSDDKSTRGYGGRVLFDGRIDFEKELSHLKGSNIRSFPSFIWREEDGSEASTNSSLIAKNNGNPVYELPLDRWIGYKFVARNSHNDSAVTLELYIDKTCGAGGGDWILCGRVEDIIYSEAVDPFYFSESLWYDGADFKTKGSASDEQHGRPIVDPDYSVYLRTDGSARQYYRSFSIREVGPEVSTSVTYSDRAAADARRSRPSPCFTITADRLMLVSPYDDEYSVTLCRLDGAVISKARVVVRAGGVSRITLPVGGKKSCCTSIGGMCVVTVKNRFYLGSVLHLW